MTELRSWHRPLFKAPSGEPWICYILFGQFPPSPRVSRAEHKVASVPPGVELRRYEGADAERVRDSFTSGFPWEQLVKEDPELSERVRQSPDVVIAMGQLVDAEDLDQLRDTVGLVAAFLDEGGAAVFDPQTFGWWTAESWRADFISDETPDLLRHITIIVSDDLGPDALWLHSRGLRKFGRPDLSMHRVPAAERDFRAAVVADLARQMAEGLKIRAGQVIRADDYVARCYLRGHVDDPDFNNEHLEIVPLDPEELEDRGDQEF